LTLPSYPGRTFAGTVASVQPAGVTTSNVVKYTVLISADPTDVPLLPEMTATATIIAAQAEGVLVVPNSAISYAQTQPGGRSANGPEVLVLREGTPTRLAIQTGISDGRYTVVQAGLQPGDQVITGAGSAGRSASINP
jgi:multidrug efflux pump subunit AcrA (membrane-fusion protein)